MAILTVDSYDNAEGAILDIYQIGGKRLRVQPPFQPYMYSTRPIRDGEPMQKLFLSDMQLHDVWKMEFNDSAEQQRWRSPFTIEDHFPFKMQVAIDKGYKFSSPMPETCGWDIETTLAGLSPDWRRDTIKSIAIWDEHPRRKQFFSGEPRLVIQDFLKAWNEVYNPDVPIDFFGRFYDYPTLMQNCQRFGIECKMGRDGSTPYIQSSEFERRGKGHIENTILIRGRAPFDVQKETDADYTLTLAGLKNKGLKEVAKYYGFNPIEIDYDKMHLLTERELEAYNVSDAKVSKQVGDIYFRTLWELAEYLEIPVNMIIQRNPSWVSNIVLGRKFHAQNIVSDAPNCERFPQFFQPGKKAIQGAEPKAFRSGIYTENVKHKDFSGMYVSIMRALNLSPETVSLVSIKPYTGKIGFKPYNGGCIVEIPDNINGQVSIRIDLSKKGIQTEILDDVVNQRNAVKAEAKLTKDEGLKNSLNSKQIMLKLVGNSIFGYHAMSYAAYGNVLIGCINTGIARYLINSECELEEKAGNINLEVDTDGLFLVENNPVQLNIAELFPDCFNIDLIRQETENVDGMIILEDISGDPAAKSYILKMNGKITFHGSSILGRHIPLVIDAFTKELATCLFNGEDTYSMFRSWNKKRILSYPTKAFVSQASFSKNPEEYNESSMYYGLYKTLKASGIEAKCGEKINYVKCINGYTPMLCFKDSDKIDVSHFQSRMCDVASRITGKSFKELKQYFDETVKMEMFF